MPYAKNRQIEVTYANVTRRLYRSALDVYSFPNANGKKYS